MCNQREELAGALHGEEGVATDPAGGDDSAGLQVQSSQQGVHKWHEKSSFAAKEKKNSS